MSFAKMLKGKGKTKTKVAGMDKDAKEIMTEAKREKKRMMKYRDGLTKSSK